MGKKIVAKTNIAFGKPGGEQVDIAAGDEVKPSELGMTKKQLTELYDAGAIELQESADEREEDKEKESSESGVKATDEPTPGSSAPVKSTPAKATTSEVKSDGKGNPA